MADTAKLGATIRALRAKTLENGCTEAEALAAAAKVAELVDRHDLSLTDIEIRAAQCERGVYEDSRNKRVPLSECVGAIAAFCDCRVWREKGAAKQPRFVFFGLPADVDAALCLTEIIDAALRTELGAFKATPGYRDFRHADRHIANTSFLLGMAGSVADRLMAMIAERRHGDGRDIVVRKASVIDAELAAIGVQTRDIESTPRMIVPDAYTAGEAVGSKLTMSKSNAKI